MLGAEMVDSIVYQGTKTVWVTGWQSKNAAVAFSEVVKQRDDVSLVLRIERDYTMLDRADA